MFGLEIVIGLIFVYLLISPLVFTSSEQAMKVLYSRGKNFYIALQTMLDDDREVLCNRFFAYPLSTKLKKKGNNEFPSYISNE